MVDRALTVTSELGLHARAAAKVIQAIEGLNATVFVRLGKRAADARSILDLMLLGASFGNVIHVTASGEDEEHAIAAITALALAGFGSPENPGRT